jgi:subtilisin family serine protease
VKTEIYWLAFIKTTTFQKGINMKKRLFLLSTLIVMFAMVFSNAIPTRAQTTDTWAGAWQMGPSMDSSLWGGTAGDGIARISGIDHNGFVYILGGRSEDNNTSGAVFKMDVGTKTFSATGAVMETPVSNYLLSKIENDGTGHGPGLYLLGGRKQDATQSNLIQVYYPQDNTVSTIATDLVPGVARNIGGQVVVGGKLYIFGGFDGVTMYTETYLYDPALAPGARWSTVACNLPTPRSYIASVAVGAKIYSIGGDEFNAGSLVPIAQTLVLDTANLSACWQDAGMADLPSPNGDAPAVFVSHADNAYLGGAQGAIFVVGGYWPAPGPYRHVFRYDIAANAWETFPDLAIPAPATGRRNQAAVFVPDITLNGLGTGVPGIWTFGGYDGSAANAMTETSEFFSITNGPAVLLPEKLEAISVPGGTAVHNFFLLNQSGSDQVFDLSQTSDQPSWLVTMPSTLAVANNTTGTFTMSVAIPGTVSCPATAHFTVTATAQDAPAVTDSQAVTVKAVCGLAGTVTDANTGLPLQNAYVWMQTDPDGLTGDYYDAYTNAAGEYLMLNVNTGTYLLAADRIYYQPSFNPGGWPGGAVSVTIPNLSGPVNVALKASEMNWETGPTTVTVALTGEATTSVTLGNIGTGPLRFSTSVLDAGTIDFAKPVPPSGVSAGLQGLPRLDPQVQMDLENSANGTADFVVVLNSKADMSSAASISDWNTRGQYVYDTLTTFANQSQAGLRKYLDVQGASYTPLYIINAVIVRGGNSVLVNHLLARPDVAQIAGNHAIPVEKSYFDITSQPFAIQQPEAIGWNVTRVKAPDVWSTYSVKGEGITVAEIDTGTQWDHPALKSKYRGWDGTTANHNYNWFDPYNQSPLVPADTNGHGTHVMGSMVGDDGGANQIGVAPGAKWITCKGGDDTSGYLLTTQLLECAQWIIAPTDLLGANPDPSKRPDVVNNSWGGGPLDYWYSDATAAWAAAGIFPQFANGNAGPSCSTAHSPGDYWNTFAAGATTNAAANTIADFSSRGPAVGTGILKPNVSAPGASIRSSLPGNTYGSYSGTSMASPHVAGVIALLWSADPELKGQIGLTGQILSYSAVPLLSSTQLCGSDTPTSHPNNVYGYGLVDAKAAVDLARGYKMPTWIKVNPVGGNVDPSEAQELEIKFTPPADLTPGIYSMDLWILANDPYNHNVTINFQVNVIPAYKFFLPGVMKTP